MVKTKAAQQADYTHLTWPELNRKVWSYQGVKGELLSTFPYLKGTPKLEVFENVSREFEQARKAGATLEDLKPKALKIHEALYALMAACKKP